MKSNKKFKTIIEALLTDDTLNKELKLMLNKKADNDEFHDIYCDGQKVGQIGLSKYDDIKALGLGSFEIEQALRGQGIGRKIIEYIIDKYKSKYDLIYCYVDKNNEGAIRLYNRIGKVFTDITNEDGSQYYVEFYNNKITKLNEGYTKLDYWPDILDEKECDLILSLLENIGEFSFIVKDGKDTIYKFDSLKDECVRQKETSKDYDLNNKYFNMDTYKQTHGLTSLGRLKIKDYPIYYDIKLILKSKSKTIGAFIRKYIDKKIIILNANDDPKINNLINELNKCVDSYEANKVKYERIKQKEAEYNAKETELKQDEINQRNERIQIELDKPQKIKDLNININNIISTAAKTDAYNNNKLLSGNLKNDKPIKDEGNLNLIKSYFKEYAEELYNKISALIEQNKLYINNADLLDIWSLIKKTYFEKFKQYYASEEAKANRNAYRWQHTTYDFDKESSDWINRNLLRFTLTFNKSVEDSPIIKRFIEEFDLDLEKLQDEGLIKYRTDARDDRFLSAYITFKYNEEDEVPETLQNLKLKDYNDDSARVIYFGDRYYNQSGKNSRNVSLFDLALMLLNAGFELR